MKNLWLIVVGIVVVVAALLIQRAILAPRMERGVPVVKLSELSNIDPSSVGPTLIQFSKDEWKNANEGIVTLQGPLPEGGIELIPIPGGDLPPGSVYGLVRCDKGCVEVRVPGGGSYCDCETPEEPSEPVDPSGRSGRGPACTTLLLPPCQLGISTDGKLNCGGQCQYGDDCVISECGLRQIKGSNVIMCACLPKFFPQEYTQPKPVEK